MKNKNNNRFKDIEEFGIKYSIINPKVTIIVATYNNEEYIDRCLISLLKQTLKEIEIIVVNDGSTDNTESILNEYCEFDSRIKVINQENSKQGTARNKGLDIAQGEFITFVDSDDWIDEDYCEKLYNAAIKNNVNIAAATITRDYKNKVKNHLKFEKEEIFKGANEIVKALKMHLETHSKLYRFENIKDIRFPQEVFYEDAPYALEAILKEESMVSVPDAHYHYFSNNNSTIKGNYDIRNENDKIEMNLLLIDKAKKNNVDIGEFAILKERHLFWTVKHYLDYKDYYLFGIKVCRKNIPFKREKVFLVFNTSYFGDALLCNSLCQNIKRAFPESKVVFVVNKGFEDAALYQKDVDDVIVFDKNGEHKGLIGIIKFLKSFKYKNIFASFVTYRSGKNIQIAKLLKSKFVNIGIIEKIPTPSQIKHNMLLAPLTHRKIKNYPIRFNLPEGIENPVKNYTDQKYIVLCATGKIVENYLKTDTAIELINKFSNETNYKIVFIGKGNESIKYSQQLKNAGCDFIDLADKTTILELGSVIKGADAVISIDTGTMHYAISLDKPICTVFYNKKKIINWAPDPNLYNSVIISENQSAQNIFDSTQKLLKKDGALQNV